MNKRREDDLARELRAHLDLEAEEQRRAGLTSEDARYAALRAFGNRISIEEDTRKMWHWISFENFTKDLRHAGRLARNNALFTSVAILTLALGIGANTGIFSVVDTVLLRPLPYRDPSRLVRIWTRNDSLGVHSGPASFLDFADWKNSGAFQDAGLYNVSSSLVRIGDSSERFISGVATTSLFSTLGVQPLLGRLPSAEEDKPGASPVTLLSESLWRSRFGADPAIIGRAISVDARPSIVVGVLPASFVFARSPELWLTFRRGEFTTRRIYRSFSILARLRPGETFQEADNRLVTLCIHLGTQYPDADKGWSANVFPWQEAEVGPARTELLVLLGAVCLVLFICCGNVAMLVLVRGIGRTREFGLRAALGASRVRIILQLLTENLVLALAGGALGLAFAAWCVKLLVQYGPRDIPRLAEVHVDARVILFALALSVLTPIVFGLGPALQLSKTDVGVALQEGGKSATLGRRRALLRSGFLIAEMALSLVLLAGAGLLVKSFLRLASVAPGFRTDHLLTFQLAMPSAKFMAGDQYQESRVAQYYAGVLERLERLPRAESVGGSLDIPMAGGGVRSWGGFAVPGNSATAISKTICVLQLVTPGYFGTLGIPVKMGRAFTDRDNKTSPPVAIVNEAFAHKYLAGRNPLGASVQVEGFPKIVPIVGVVGDVKPDSLDSEANPEIYGPFAQGANPFMMVAIRTKVDPLLIAADVRRELQEADPDIPAYRIRSGDQIVALSLAERRFSMALVASFALLALLLSAIGLYGVVSYTVTQSTREIGIRIALGARARDAVLLALRQGLIPSLAGLAIGLALAIALTRLLSKLLFQVRPLDAEVFALVSLALVLVCCLACALPARRAARIDPATALRYE